MIRMKCRNGSGTAPPAIVLRGSNASNNGHEGGPSARRFRANFDQSASQQLGRPNQHCSVQGRSRSTSADVKAEISPDLVGVDGQQCRCTGSRECRYQARQLKLANNSKDKATHCIAASSRTRTAISPGLKSMDMAPFHKSRRRNSRLAAPCFLRHSLCIRRRIYKRPTASARRSCDHSRGSST